MKVAIATRIFEPEPAAASFRLAALAEGLTEAGHRVVVETVLPWRNAGLDTRDTDRTYRVRRHRVLRDKTGYVRGYLQYMSFDIPLFFRLLVGKKPEFIVVEPPPTTGFFVSLVAALRKVPYAYYAADIWSDASESTGAPALVVKFVRALERRALGKASIVFAVNDGVEKRALEIAPNANTVVIGNGINTSVFHPALDRSDASPYLIYSGTASEWQGADIFISAFAKIAAEFPHHKLVFLGGGSDWQNLEAIANRLVPDRVQFIPSVPQEEAAEWMRNADLSLASIRPESGYNFAFPTKVFAAWASGIPVLYAADPGPVDKLMREHSNVELGAAVEYDEVIVAQKMRELLVNRPEKVSRRKLGSWAAENVSLNAVAKRAIAAIEERL